MSTLEHESMKQHRQIRSLKDALLAEKHTANQLRDLIATLNAQIRRAPDPLCDGSGTRIEQLERELAEARQREEDAVSQHDTLRDQRDAEKALADRLADILEWDRKDGRMEAIAAYRKARGL